MCDPQIPSGIGPYYTSPPAPVIHPPGCICPPTSEKTCESPVCPRKNHLRSFGLTTTGGVDKPKTT
jgi:hypothetical protein